MNIQYGSNTSFSQTSRQSLLNNQYPRHYPHQYPSLQTVPVNQYFANPYCYNFSSQQATKQRYIQRQLNTFEPVKEIEHQIQYGDTLEGLSLQYNVPINKIKQRNKIQTDTIYYMKKLIIPNPTVTSYTNQQLNDEQMKIQEVIDHMPLHEKSKKTAKYYLQENNWIVADAVANMKKDVEWQRRNKVTIQSQPIQIKHKSNGWLSSFFKKHQ